MVNPDESAASNWLLYLFRFSPRWHEVHIEVPYSFRPEVWNPIKGNLPVLSTLTLDFTQTSGFGFGEPFDAFLIAPKLRSVTAIEFDLYKHLLPHSQLTQVHLTPYNIELDVMPEVYHLLSEATQLRSFTMDFNSMEFDNLPPPPLQLACTPARYISIEVAHALSQFHFNAPALEELCLQELDDLTPLVAFLGRSQCPLRIIRLGVRYDTEVPVDVFLAMLSAVPSLREVHITVGCSGHLWMDSEVHTRPDILHYQAIIRSMGANREEIIRRAPNLHSLVVNTEGPPYIEFVNVLDVSRY